MIYLFNQTEELIDEIDEASLPVMIFWFGNFSI